MKCLQCLQQQIMWNALNVWKDGQNIQFQKRRPMYLLKLYVYTYMDSFLDV